MRQQDRIFDKYYWARVRRRQREHTNFDCYHRPMVQEMVEIEGLTDSCWNYDPNLCAKALLAGMGWLDEWTRDDTSGSHPDCDCGVPSLLRDEIEGRRL